MEQRKQLSLDESSIIKALLYFDIFNYPLTAHEIRCFATNNVSENTVEQNLNVLINKGLVFNIGNFYSVQNNFDLVNRRSLGNQRAESTMTTAFKFGRIIYRFPYVRSVCVSGSLSKNYIDENGDIDYFVITKPGRLWIARTLLILYKKIFLLNSHRFFCVNYFIDTDHFEIIDKNIFTATELLTLKPLHGITIFNDFLNQNKWATDFLPNLPPSDIKANTLHLTKSTNVFERVFNNKLGDNIDTFCMKLTLKKWKHKFKTLAVPDFEVAMRTRKYVSKHHPQNFQQRVLATLEKNKLSFQMNKNITIHD